MDMINSISSMQTALLMLSGTSRPGQSLALLQPGATAPAAAHAAARPAGTVASGGSRESDAVAEEQTRINIRRVETEIGRIRDIYDRLAAGTLSPLSDEAASLADVSLARVDRWAAAPGEADEGWFALAKASFAGTAAGQAAFVDRQTALLNAYHYGSDLAKSARDVAHYTRLNAAVAAGRITGGYGHELDNTTRQMDRSAAMLKAQFGLTADVVQKTADGSSAFQGFEVRHETYGLLMTVAADGAITLHDAGGTGHSAADYNGRNPDAFIPELQNDLARAKPRTPMEVLDAYL